MKVILFLATSLILSSALGADTPFSSKGDITFESRFFEPDNRSKTHDLGYGLASRLEVDWKDKSWEQKYRLFHRNDDRDDSRSVFIIEEAYLGYSTKSWGVKIGNQILNWSATEAFHPADIINSRNLDSNIENAEKFGEPMVQLSLFLDSSALHFFALPYLTDVKLPSNTNRLGFQATKDLTIKEALWLERDGTISDDNFAPQFALKYDLTLGNADIAFYYLQMQDRFFTGSATETQLSVPVAARPIFLPINQYGVTYQHAVWDGIVLKLESGFKDFINPDQNFTLSGNHIIDYQRPDHWQIAWGIEYGMPHSNGTESTFILEGQNFEGTTANKRISLGMFQRDILIGHRFAFNDENSRELMTTFIFDLERDEEYLFSINYAQRLSDTWGIKTGLRMIYAPKKDTNPTGLENLDGANYATINLTRYF